MSKETKKHTKHTTLIKPVGGEYHRNEWTFIGAPCGVIHETVRKLNKDLIDDFKIGYLDAAHEAEAMDEAFYLHFTDRIHHQSLETKQTLGQKQHRKYYNELDLLFVNGNHFKGDKQVVFISEKKKDSLYRKLDRLTNIQAVILEHEGQELHDYLLDQISHEIPRILLSDTKGLSKLMCDHYFHNIPEVYGLILSGGKSQRMGQDKGALDYRGMPHRDYLANLIKPYCTEVFMSCRKEQLNDWETDYAKLLDTFIGLGPYGAILSAFREQPNKAWMTLACDLPYLDASTIAMLSKHRNPLKLATCFHNPDTSFPEPLITIWEPRAYPMLLEFLSQGYSCPRKVLINTDIEEIHLDDHIVLDNANDPASFQKAKESLKTDSTI